MKRENLNAWNWRAYKYTKKVFIPINSLEAILFLFFDHGFYGLQMLGMKNYYCHVRQTGR